MRVALKVLTFSLLHLHCSTLNLQAQSLQDHLQKGDRFYQRKDYASASKSYREALALDPRDPHTNYRAGISYVHEEDYGQAATYLQVACDQQPDIDPDLHYHLGVAYQKSHQFQKGREHFQTLMRKNKRLAALARQKMAECILGDSLMKLTQEGDVEQVEGLNSSFDDMAPVLSGDGNAMIFTSTRSSDQYEIKSGTNRKDVYISRKSKATWETPEKIGQGINVKYGDAATSLSPDGRTLLLHYEDGNGDIYMSSNDNGSWSQPVALNKFINHPQYGESSACISPDGQRLYFSSNRPGGRGGFDLYVSLLGANGDWGRPSNLGPMINTRGDEESPFIHSDGTIYFSSDGHASLGESDIFASALKEKKFSTPRNLGYPINTSADESGFVLTQDGRTGYFNSRRAARSKGTDIYQVTFQSPYPDVPVTAKGATTDIPNQGMKAGIVADLKGSVVDADDGTPLAATIRLVDNSNNKVIAAVSTGASGNFELTIPKEGNYGLTAAKPGYLFSSMNLEVPNKEKPQRMVTHIVMVKARVGSKVVMKNIFFDTDEAVLKAASIAELENIRDLLVSNPGWQIQINGHTDNVGHPEANRVLSLKRAEAVVAYLVKEGIVPERLQARGFGSERPLVSNDDEEDGRQLNRRTEIEIIR